LLNFIVILLLIVLIFPAGARGEKNDPFSITFSAGWQNICRNNEWTPIEFIVSSQTEKPFIGQIVVSLPQDSLHQMVLHQPLLVMPAQTVRVPLIIKMTSVTDTCRVSLYDKDSNLIFYQTFELFDYRRGRTGIIMANQNDTLIAVCGKGSLSLPYMGKINAIGSQIYTCNTYITNLPHAWTGYRGLDLLVLYDPDWSLLSPSQTNALAQWITNGGQVIIILGTKFFPADSPLAQLIPFKPDPPQTVTIPVESLTKLTAVPSAKPLNIPAWKFPRNPLPAGWSATINNSAGDPIVLNGSVGFGQIVLYAFDLKQLVPSVDEQSLAFWNTQFQDLLHPAKQQKDNADKNQLQYMRYGFMSASDLGVNNILSHVMGITELEPISVWWILAFLGTMALLIGPVDYMVLKRLNRLPWTYVTFLIILAVFTAVAYFGVEFLRAGHNQLRRFVFIDKIQSSPYAWQTGFTGIYASRSGDYTLTDLPGDGWWSGIAPAQQYYGPTAGIKSIVECVQQQGNIPVSLPVNIWSMRTLIDEQPAADFPLTAKIVTTPEGINATITNTGKGTIDSGSIRINDQWWDFENILPGKSIAIQSSPTLRGSVHPTWHDVNINPQQQVYAHGSQQFSPKFSFQANGIFPRSHGIERLVAQGHAVVYAQINNAADCPIRVKNKKTDILNITYVRLIIPILKTGSQP